MKSVILTLAFVNLVGCGRVANTTESSVKSSPIASYTTCADERYLVSINDFNEMYVKRDGEKVLSKTAEQNDRGGFQYLTVTEELRMDGGINLILIVPAKVTRGIPFAGYLERRQVGLNGTPGGILLEPRRSLRCVFE